MAGELCGELPFRLRYLAFVLLLGVGRVLNHLLKTDNGLSLRSLLRWSEEPPRKT